MGGGISAIGAILAILGAAIIISLAIYGGFHVLVSIEERFRPIEPSDDELGDIAHVPEGFASHIGTHTGTGA